jgi:hypothetical protein
MKLRPLALLAAFLPNLTLSLAGAPAESDLTLKDQEQLQRDKVLVIDRSYKQIFSPYVDGGMPAFVTSDSVLNAWHVLFEESVANAEERLALALPRALDLTLAGLQSAPGDMKSEEYDRAVEYARIVVGTATKLAGGSWSGGQKMDAIIEEEVRWVEGAHGLRLPPWLPQLENLTGIDYKVFKPGGFYTRSQRMQRYFRAVRWLQTIPFRLNRKDEMAAMALLVPAFCKSATVLDIAEFRQSIGGTAADADVHMVICERPWNDPAEEFQKWQNEAKPGCKQMVILSASNTPDAKLFLQTTNEQRPYPDGLEIAAWLGSPMALDLLKPVAGDDVVRQVVAHRILLDQKEYASKIYDDYLRCLALLLTPPEPDTPVFMKSSSWQRKSLNTALAGWAQLRHTWALQSKESMVLIPARELYPGFVEPNPEFFHRMYLLILKTEEAFDSLGALSFSPDFFAVEARELIPLLEQQAESIKQKIAPLVESTTPGGDIAYDDLIKLEDATRPSDDLASRLEPFVGIVKGIYVTSTGRKGIGVGKPDLALSGLREAADGKLSDKFLEFDKSSKRRPLKSRWKQLLEVCHELESLAHKQLRGIDQTEEEKKFIDSYGGILGGIMFYDGDSFFLPRDDAPRITTVFNRPGGKCMLAGVGRPREIRVLYPWKGQEIECRGAVMPYHEFLSDQHLTDKEWLQCLDGKVSPELPKWLKPVISNDR